MKIFIGLSLCVIACLYLQPANAVQKLAERFKALHDMSMRRPVIRLSNEMFEEYLKPSPRNYSMFIMLTALRPGRGCTVCKQANDEFQVLASSYYYSSARSSNFFLALADYDDAQNVFSALKMNSAPAFYYYPSQGKPKKTDQMPIQQIGFDAEVLASFVAEKTGIHVQITRPPNYMLAMIAALAMAVLAGLLYVKRDTMDFLFQRQTWGYLILTFILFMMSGQMWNKIRGAGFAHYDRDGGVSFISPSAQNQFVAESYIVMALHGATAVGVILMNAAFKQKTTTTANMYAGIGFGMFVLFFSWIYSIFRMKYQGYPYRFLL